MAAPPIRLQIAWSKLNSTKVVGAVRISVNIALTSRRNKFIVVQSISTDLKSFSEIFVNRLEKNAFWIQVMVLHIFKKRIFNAKVKI